MNERKVVRRLKAGDTGALSEVIEYYGPYVCTIVSNITDVSLPREDTEEIVSDAFVSLWYNRENIVPGKLKNYLAAIARNKAKSALRSLHIPEPLENDMLMIEAPENTEREVLFAELSLAAQDAVKSLGEPDSEIFKRYYYFYQTAEEIGRALNIPGATVRTKLVRGRKRLCALLTERGFSCEDTDF